MPDSSDHSPLLHHPHALDPHYNQSTSHSAPSLARSSVPSPSSNWFHLLQQKDPPEPWLRSRRAAIWKNAAINLFFISSWYFFATLISLYNKWMFSPEHYNFQYPLFVSCCHMFVQFGLASLTLASFTSLRPNTRPTSHDYAKKAMPCGVASGLDIGLSNTSLKTVTLSFYTMCKSSSLAFVLLFAFIFKLERPTYKLTGIILLITCGVVLMVSSETKFEFWGMLEVLSASCLGGLRWSLTQMLLDKKSMGMSTPLATVFWLAPTMGLTLALCSLAFENWAALLAEQAFFGDITRSLRTMTYIVGAGVLAFLMTISEYFLIQRTSVVTLSIAGIFKEVGTIFLSTIVFGDVMTPLNISGLAITLFGIILYNILKYQQNLHDVESSRSGLGGGGVTQSYARRTLDIVLEPRHKQQGSSSSTDGGGGGRSTRREFVGARGEESGLRKVDERDDDDGEEDEEGEGQRLIEKEAFTRRHTLTDRRRSPSARPTHPLSHDALHPHASSLSSGSYDIIETQLVNSNPQPQHQRIQSCDQHVIGTDDDDDEDGEWERE